MIKQTIQYTDFNGKPQVEEARFVVTKTQLTKNMHLKTKLERLQIIMGGDAKELTMDEVVEVIELVKEFIRLSYGELLDDGKTFMQNEELHEKFKYTAAYDAFLFSLFENPEKAFEFMIGVLPKDLTDRARVELEKQNDPVVLDGAPQMVTEPPVAPQASDPTAPVTTVVDKNWSEYSKEELLAMPQADFDRIAGTGAQELKARGLLEIAFERKTRG